MTWLLNRFQRYPNGKLLSDDKFVISRSSTHYQVSFEDIQSGLVPLAVQADIDVVSQVRLVSCIRVTNLFTIMSQDFSTSNSQMP